MIESLFYTTSSRPNIAFIVGVYARFQSNPKESHLTTIKRILKYLSATIDYDVWYSKDPNLSLAGYLNAKWSSNTEDRKSVTRKCFILVET